MEAANRETGGRRSKTPAPHDNGTGLDPALLTAEIEHLNARLDRIERSQEEQHLLVMKFLIVRSISMLTLLVEQSPAPQRIRAEALLAAEEATAKIAQARDLDELHQIDPHLQTQLKNVIRTFTQP